MHFFLAVGGHGTCGRPWPGATPERGGRAGAGRGGSVGAPVGCGYGARRGLRWGTAPVVLAVQLWLGLGRGLQWGMAPLVSGAGCGHAKKKGNRTERSVICLTSDNGG